MDQSFRAQWRSGPVSVLIYGITLIMTYILIARAIDRGDLSFGYILLPFIFEYLLMAWIGVLLARSWVREPIFVAISGRVGIAAGWTIALLTPYVLVLAWQAVFGLDPDAGSLSASWKRFVDSGMVWACVALTVGLLMDTSRDVSAWRVSGGPFVWPATHRFGFRLAGLIAVWFALPFVIGLYVFVSLLLAMAGLIVEQGEPLSGEFNLSWMLFFSFMATDLLVLIVGTWLHRRELRIERDLSAKLEE